MVMMEKADALLRQKFICQSDEILIIDFFFFVNEWAYRQRHVSLLQI